MRLYYFTTAEHGLAAIRDQRLKIAEIDKLNDPFELLGMALVDQQREHAMKIGVKATAKTKGLLSMSKSWNNPLMWGHYADKHSGICLGFDTKPGNFEEVVYIKERYKYTDDIIKKTPNYIYRTKFEGWKYEEEYRLLCPLENQDPVTDLYFKKFDKDLSLHSVIIGYKSNIEHGRVERVISPDSKNIEIFRAMPSVRAFKMVKEQPNYLRNLRIHRSS